MHGHARYVQSNGTSNATASNARQQQQRQQQMMQYQQQQARTLQQQQSRSQSQAPMYDNYYNSHSMDRLPPRSHNSNSPPNYSSPSFTGGIVNIPRSSSHEREHQTMQQNNTSQMSTLKISTPNGVTIERRSSLSNKSSPQYSNLYEGTQSDLDKYNSPRTSLGRMKSTDTLPWQEGDYVWVKNPNSVSGNLFIPAVIVRMGYKYDDASDSEHAVIIVHTEDGEEREIRDGQVIKLPECHHPKILPPLQLHDLSSAPLSQHLSNGETEEFTLEQLEAVVSYALRARYRMEMIYTWVDRVLISINPMQSLPLYTPDHMQAYSASGSQSDKLENQLSISNSVLFNNNAKPHIFAVAQNSINNMKETTEDQAIILVGEVGSGKSEAAKLIVQYLCEIGENSLRSDLDTDPAILHPVAQQLLHAFTILDSFGIARTHSNRNSSRFSKTISVEFNKHGNVIGGGFTTHYFEKSRIVNSTQPGIHNFHVFFQVLAGVQRDPSLRDELQLNKSAGEFELLKSSTLPLNGNDANGIGHPQVHQKNDPLDRPMDFRDYRDLLSSLSALRVRKNQRLEIMRIVAALLHLGNLDFVNNSSDNSGYSTSDTNAEDTGNGSADNQQCAVKDPATLLLVAKLLDIEINVLDNYFRTRQFFSKDAEGKVINILKIVTPSQARKARDTFMRSLYEALFNFLVETLNGMLGGIFDRYEKSNIAINSQGIHVVDIIGFESLLQNGFDQLCGNYWAEKVRSFYMTNTVLTNSIFRLEDEHHHVEQRMTLSSNQRANRVDTDVIQILLAFESDPNGIFELVNEHCRARPPPKDDVLVANIMHAAERMGITQVSKPQSKYDSSYPARHQRLLFQIEHYGGRVTYCAKGFATRNSMTISSTCASIMSSSKNSVLRLVGGTVTMHAKNDSGTKGKLSSSSKLRSSLANAKQLHGKDAPSVANDVVSQASALLEGLSQSGKTFVVCIKPSLSTPSSFMDRRQSNVDVSANDNQMMEEITYDGDYVLKQIRNANIVELIQASRSIFTIQLVYNHFYRLYKNLCNHRGTLDSLLRSLAAIGILEDSKFVVGREKVYLTSYQSKKLEQARVSYVNACATMIQRAFIRKYWREHISKQLLISLRGLREAMMHRNTEQITHFLLDCNASIGNDTQKHIRVLNDAHAMVASLEEEKYVYSIIDGALAVNHNSVLKYALCIANKCSSSIDVENVKGQIVNSNFSQAPRRLREAIINQESPESLMGVLTALEGKAGADSLERRLATMLIIRSLEEKKTISAVSAALKPLKDSSIESNIPSYAEILDLLRKVIELNIVEKVPEVGPAMEEMAALTSEQFLISEDSSAADDVSNRKDQESLVEAHSGLLLALRKALDEDNLVAVEKILGRIDVLGIPPTPDILTARQQLDSRNGSITFASHDARRQTVKFLAIAKVSQDIDILTQAIDEAVASGVAKWDFNLKNAEKERQLLIENLKLDSPIVGKNGTMFGNNDPVELDQNWAFVSQVWKATDIASLQSLLNSAPTIELEKFAEAKFKHVGNVSKLSADIESAVSSSSDVSAIEKAFQTAITLGAISSSTFTQLFARYDQIIASYHNNGLRATVQFLNGRMEMHAELRDDALKLLVDEISAFNSRHIEIPPTEMELQVLKRAEKLKQRLETYLNVSSQLQSLLALPSKNIDQLILERTVEAAKQEGLYAGLLMKAEQKLALVQRNANKNDTDTNVQDFECVESDQGNSNETDDEPILPANLERMSSDIGDDSDTKYLPLTEKGALAFNEYIHLRANCLGSQSAAHADTTVINRKSKKPNLHWEGRVLTKSLCLLEDPKLSQLALVINRCILGYMRDRIVFYREMLAQYILQTGLVQTALVDEIYVQLMKQLTKNLKRESSTRGWSLFAMCCSSFPPSKALEPYLLAFLKAQNAETNSFWRLVKNFAMYCLKKLEDLIENGTSGYIPSIDEILGYEACPPFLADITLIDGTPLANSFPVTPDLTVEQLLEICAHFLGLEERLGKLLGVVVIAESVRTGTSSSKNTNKLEPSSSVPGESQTTSSYQSSFVSTTLLTSTTDNYALNNESGDNSEDSLDMPKLSQRESEPSLRLSTTMSTHTPNYASSSSSFFHKFVNSNTFLTGRAHLGDTFQKELMRGRSVRFVLKVRLTPIAPHRDAQMLGDSTDEVFQRMMVIQALDEFSQGNLPLLKEDIVVRLAALAIGADVVMETSLTDDNLEMGNYDESVKFEDMEIKNLATFGRLPEPETTEGMMELVNVMDYIPPEWQPKHSEHTWAGRILTYWKELNKQRESWSSEELEQMFMDEISRHRLYGSAFFPCRLVRKSTTSSVNGIPLPTTIETPGIGNSLPSHFLLAVNGSGVHFLNRQGLLIAARSYSDLLSFGGNHQEYTLILNIPATDHPTPSGTMNASDVYQWVEEIVIAPRHSRELSSVLKDYKEITSPLSE